MWHRDIRFAVRAWVRDPGFAGAAVLVLALGIGLAVGGAAVARAYLSRPLPYPAAERVYSVRIVPEGADWRIVPAGLAEVEWEGLDRVAEKVGTWDLDAFSLVGDAAPEQVRGAWVTPALLELTGARAELGRLLEPADVGDGGARVAVISHGLWQRRFGGSADVLGRTIRTFSADRPEDAEVFEIVGVLARDYWHVNNFTDVMVPLTAGRTPYMVRLREGVDPAAAGEWMTSHVRARLPGTDPSWRMGLVPVRDSYVGGVRGTLRMILAAAGLVLLTACGNVAVLMLVRATRRERELGIRRALGASRGRLGRQLVTEAVLLTGAAAVLGTAAAALALDVAGPLLEARLGLRVPGGAGALRLDGATAALAALAAVATGVLFGLIPLLARGGRLGATLRSGTRTTESGGRRRARTVLMAGEVAVSLSLLILAGLLARSALNIHALDLGFEPRNAMVASLQLRARSHPEDGARLQLFRALRERVAQLPGVEGAGLIAVAPLTYRFGASTVQAEDGDATAEAVLNMADEGYARAAGLRLREGRWFTAADDAAAAPVAVVSAGAARALWPGESAAGRYVRVVRSPGAAPDSAAAPAWLAVVGVVDDVRKTLTGEHLPDLFLPLAQAVPLNADLVVRGAAPLAALPGIRAAVAELDPEIPVASPRTVEALVAEERAGTDFLAALLAAFSVLTLCLAVIGLYGVMAYGVRQRRREVAIRMALGAPGAQVVRAFLREGLAIAGAGALAGLLAAAALGRLAAGQLHGVSPADPATYLTLTVALVAAAAAASWLPARQAARTDPGRVLRDD